MNNPFDSGDAYSNALLGVFQQYTEATRAPARPAPPTSSNGLRRTRGARRGSSPSITGCAWRGTRTTARETAARPSSRSTAFTRLSSFYYSELAQSDRHTLVVNDSWELPRGSRFVNDEIGRILLDGWQL